MKNLKKLSREELKSVSGGFLEPTGDYKCCIGTNCSEAVHHEHGSDTISCSKGILTPA